MAVNIDTLHRSGLDTLSEYRLRRMTEGWTGDLYPAEAADSLEVDGVVSDATFADMVEKWRMARSVYRNADADSVFGESSVLTPNISSLDDASGIISADTLSNEVFAADSAATTFSLHPDLVLNGAVMIIVLAYMYCIYRYYDDVLALIQSAFHRSVIVADRVNERRRSDIFYGFLGKLLLLGLGFVGVFFTFWAVHAGGKMFGFSAEQISLSPLVGMGLFLVVIAVQYLMLIIAGAVTRSLHTTSHLLRMRLTYFVFATVAVAPVFLISQMAVEYNIWYVIASLTALLVLILYLRESLDLFISKKISILHWILYLCTVEIVPLTLLWQIAIRVRL